MRGWTSTGRQWESCVNTHGSSMTTVDIDSLLAQDDVRALLETSEHAGTIRVRELADLV